MNYQDMDLQRSYISKGDNNFADAFLNPVLSCTKEYKRSVGFFTSSALTAIEEGIIDLARNGGTIKLIASPRLSEEDAQAIRLGYEIREEYILNNFTREFVAELEALDDPALNLLIELISKNILDIKIAVTDDLGIYHDKLGILRDFDDNVIAFFGSPNASLSGYRFNYERIRIAKSWQSGSAEIVAEEDKEFDQLWNNKNEFVEVYDYQETAHQQIIQIIARRRQKKNKVDIILRDYQEQAIAAWIANGYRGFFVMATGTGKTWTAIYSAKALVNQQPVAIIICAPYIHLIKQWHEDVKAAFPDANIVLVSSENPDWDKQITNAAIKSNYNSRDQLIIISTIKSFYSNKFEKNIEKYKGKRLLIVDEAHRFTRRDEQIIQKYPFMLGLSATPFSGTSAVKGNELMAFFGGKVFDLPIEEALERGYLVPYYYRPLFVRATCEEENRFNKQNQIISSCYKNNVCIDRDKLIRACRQRLRIISMASEKQEQLPDIISKIPVQNHFIVYCGDGRLFDNTTGEEIRHIQSVKRVLSKFGYRPSQFTAKENMNERMQLIESFNRGDITVLVAIRCLDEGVNIPSIEGALILSSNDDYREFVQRRGRILRQFKDKKYATIYDIVVLPSLQMNIWAKIELRRFYEYGRLAQNWPDLKETLVKLMTEYGLTQEDIDVFDFEKDEDYEDE